MHSESTSRCSSTELPRPEAPLRSSTIPLHSAMRKVNHLLTGVAMLVIALFCQVHQASAEGSGVWGVTDNRQVNLFVPTTAVSNSVPGGGNTGYVTRGFMMLASNTGSASTPYNPAHRMYVWVKANETVFYGFRTSSGSSSVTFNWYYDNSSTGFYPTATSAPNRVLADNQTITQGNGGATGRPSNAAAATNGPNQVTNSGYTAYSFKNTTGADRAYWVEIGSNNLEFNYWDVTVASGSSGNYTRQNGRLYCKYWSVVNDLPTSLGTANATSSPSSFGFYIPIDNTLTPAQDFYVKYANFGGSNSGYAIFFANLDGPNSNLTFEQNRRSMNGSSSNAHFPLFLRNPDASVWPSPPLPIATFEAVFSRRPGSSPAAGQASFKVEIDNPSIVDILIDLNGNGFYDGKDVIISNEYGAAGTYYINWDGRDNTGADVPAGTAIHFVSSLLFYPVHFPIYDMEQSLGISIKHVRPLRSGTEPIDDKLYWDDSDIARNNINGTLSPRSVPVNVTGVLGPDHKWWANGDNGFSQNNTINTWTGAYNDEIVRELLFNYTSDVDLAVTKSVSAATPSVGQTVTFTIEATNIPLPENAGNPITATGVIVTDEIPDGYTVENVSVSKGSWNAATDTWLIGTLDENEVVTMTVTAKVNATGPYLNTAIVQGNENDDNQDNNKDDAVVVTPPTAEDDQDLRNAPGTNVTLNIISNDKLSGGSVPAAAAVKVDLDPSESGVQNSRIVTGEGVWTYAPATGEVTFAPESGFTGNPTPIVYTLTEIATSLSDQATITITYLNVPDSYNVLAPIARPVIDQVIPLNGTSGNPPLMSGIDEEDGTYFGNTGTDAHPQGVIITSLPTNGDLYYDGSLVTLNEVTTARLFTDPALFSVKMTGIGYSNTSFEYAYVDADGLTDPTPATYKLTWEGALPVTLVSFDAVVEEGQVLLSWKTSEEINASHFDVERSTNAKNWNKIKETAAAGDSRALNTYTAFDEAPLSGKSYYRLKTVDRDNTFAYSRAVSINLAGLLVSIYPNPASSTLHIKGLEANAVSRVSLTNTSGVTVATFDRIPEKGIELGRFPGGMYLVKIVAKDGSQTVRKILINK
ncbi:conserved repeat domain-containing protein/Por secretion system C-terminal sorting domain-containing protein [Dyadobacter soli]|uniref:Conserved repeat domain-containing protein/Por secretion system C-terminal sorting domain-containing protein n=1 Tax=Dyadobacter soli TaxID=659014 RepID=A0A1G7NDK9_9BACT|nr:T9SS type A sorting domain-containing protein [Dyadobacter soli]SDF72001.1 conserved repeat domain-containing protein/Por secretion system C-terminal sorting domain-containing protein [Dyadobacter soli]